MGGSMKLLYLGLFLSLVGLSHACIEYVEVALDDGVKLEGITVNHQIIFKEKNSKNLDGMKLLKAIDYKTKKEVKNLFRLDYNILSIIPVSSKEGDKTLSDSFELTFAGNDNVSKSLLLVIKKEKGKRIPDALSSESLTRSVKSSKCGGKISTGKYK